MTNQTAARTTTTTISIGSADEQHTLHLSWTWLTLWACLTAFVGFQIITNGFVNGSPLLGAALATTALGAFIAPDLAFLIGLGDHVEKGSISTKAVPMYNAAHRMTVASSFTLIVGVGLVPLGRLSLAALIGGISWMAHIAIDRAVGYGLRNPDGSRNQH